MATIAEKIRIGSLDRDCWKAFAVPWKAPWSVDGRPIAASALATEAVASLSDLPAARLNEIVVAGCVSW